MSRVLSRAAPKPGRTQSCRSANSTTCLDGASINSGQWASSPDMKLKRWDGAKRICTNWDASEEDSELYTRNGNCLIYLHSYKGVCIRRETKSSAAFKLPFSLLLEKKCFPLIWRCLATRSADSASGPRRSPDDLQRWYDTDPKRTIELFVPPPENGNGRQCQRHQLLMRNFFAWVLGRSLVGETLGDALVGLLECMYEYRSGDRLDNIADLTSYLRKEGYLCLAGQPDHALAVLRLAETFRLKTLYLQALCHCVGKEDVVSGRPDYQRMSRATRKLMDDTKEELVMRLKKTSNMLKNFLDHELSESQLGIPAGIRAHLERFRSFLLSFYSAKMGYYPPLDFDGAMYRAMTRDFAALYNLLVDESYSSCEPMPSVAVGGICTLQLIQQLDARNAFEPMKHPLPKLPQQNQHSNRPNVTTWRSWRSRQRGDDGQMNHVSLVQASNWSEDSFANGLVRAYREFEKECTLSPRQLDRKERVSLVDGRKIRWILIYAVHQTLQHATQRPAGVPDDPQAAQVVSIARHTKVPWQDGLVGGGMHRSQTEPALSRLWEPQSEAQRPACEIAEKKLEIKPDVDYFALTHKEENAASPSRPRRSSDPADSQAALPRNNSFKNAFSPNGTIRRSMRRLNKVSPPARAKTVCGVSKSHHEIVVPGYGNGTNRVHMEQSDTAIQPTRSSELVSRSASTATDTRSNRNADTMLPSAGGMEDSPDSPGEFSLSSEAPLEMPSYSRRWSHQEGLGSTAHTTTNTNTINTNNTLSHLGSVRRRPISTALDGSYSYAVKAFGHLIDHGRRGVFGPCREREDDGDIRRTRSLSKNRLTWLSTRQDGIGEEPSNWTAGQTFLDGMTSDDTSDVWEQYANLGGLTEMR